MCLHRAGTSVICQSMSELDQIIAKIAGTEADLAEAKREKDYARRDRLEILLVEQQKEKNHILAAQNHDKHVFSFGAQLDLEKTRLEEAKARLEIARLHSKMSGYGDIFGRSHGRDYFKELRDHFDDVNDTNRYALAKARHSIRVLDGHHCIFEDNFTDDEYLVKVRNLYLMFFASGYKIETFLAKKKAGEFDHFDGSSLETPPEKSFRSNVYRDPVNTWGEK